MEHELIQLIDANKGFIDGKEAVTVLNQVNLTLHQGETLALTGASGSGKSTLLNIIAGFEPLSSGQLYLNHQNTHSWQQKEWSQFRHQTLGIIFQQFNLLTPLNVKQNIAFPLSLNRQPWDEWCDHLVEKLGIASLLSRHVAALSGGQQQRVAIARALAHKPKLLLADEPTGNLDQHASLEVMALLAQLTRLNNTSVLLVTHNQICADFMQQTYHLVNGELICNTPKPC